MRHFIELTADKEVPHTGSEPFPSHLLGVFEVLRGWDLPKHVLDAGLYHSVYGTEGFDPGKDNVVSYLSRQEIVDVIGPRSEKLVFTFCVLDRSTLDKVVRTFYSGKKGKKSTIILRSRMELGAFKISLTRDEFLDFLALSLADWLEQVEGAAEGGEGANGYGWGKGEAWAYRRGAYEAMSEILIKERGLGIAMNTFRAVYGAEPEKTRNLEQRRTPPLTKAAQDAYDCYFSTVTAEEKIAIMDEWKVLERIVDETDEEQK